MTPTLDRTELDDLKAGVDLVALFEEHGVDVRRFGCGFKARCPFHEEKTPSMSLDPKKGVYHCFGCGQSGDHLTFLQQYAKRSFGEAVAELRQRARSAPALPSDPNQEAPFPYDLVDRVANTTRAFRSPGPRRPAGSLGSINLGRRGASTPREDRPCPPRSAGASCRLYARGWK